MYIVDNYSKNIKHCTLGYKNRILLLYIRGYSAKAEDKVFVKSQNFKNDSRHIKSLLFASYSLKLDDLKSIRLLLCHMDLITCLACLKNDMKIGFYKFIDIQINQIIHRSDYQTEIINYIRSSKKTQYKALENKLLKRRFNISNRIDKDLREVIDKCINYG